MAAKIIQENNAKMVKDALIMEMIALARIIVLAQIPKRTKL